ncbi:MAG: GNAT family N-acetyltransferase [Caldilineaceae bacterium]
MGHYYVIEPVPTKAPSLPPLLAYGGYWLTDDEAHVIVIATAPAWRRLRLGQWLLLELINTARYQGARAMTLEVRQHNTSAQQLYLGLGFTEVGVHKRYYRDTGEDAHLLTLFDLDGGAVWRPLSAQLAALRATYAAHDE